MDNRSFNTSILVDASPKEVFNAVLNVRGWWSEEIEGNSEKVGDVFNYHYQDLHRCRIKLIEVVPDQKVVWEVLENYFSFTEDKTEWTGTKMFFEITKKGNQTHLKVTHLGLVPEYECYAVCNEAWTNYIGESLFNLISTGKGKPILKETGNEFQDAVREKV